MGRHEIQAAPVCGRDVVASVIAHAQDSGFPPTGQQIPVPESLAVKRARYPVSSRHSAVSKNHKSLQRGDAFPASGVGGHQSKIIDGDFGREACVAFITISIAVNSGIALGKGLNDKLRESDPSGGNCRALSDLKVKTLDR